jgi:hypothetical protein
MRGGGHATITAAAFDKTQKKHHHAAGAKRSMKVENSMTAGTRSVSSKPCLRSLSNL